MSYLALGRRVAPATQLKPEQDAAHHRGCAANLTRKEMTSAG